MFYYYIIFYNWCLPTNDTFFSWHIGQKGVIIIA